jgi:GTP pyrophosphokinase
MSATTNKDRVFTMRLQFETPDPTHLASLTNALKRIPGVYEANRVKN